MRQKLILIGGPPGVGKSAVASILWTMLDRSAWLDGDDVWRIHPFRVDPERVALAEDNIAAVLRNYLLSGCSHVILTWVLHRQEIIDRILGGLDGIPFDALFFTLVCDSITLESRWRASHPTEEDVGLPLRRLRECAELNSTQIDTSELSAEQVASAIAEDLASGRC
jgi:cytidylate kinase